MSGREKERERECVCVCASMGVCMCERVRECVCVYSLFNLSVCACVVVNRNIDHEQLVLVKTGTSDFAFCFVICFSIFYGHKDRESVCV